MIGLPVWAGIISDVREYRPLTYARIGDYDPKPCTEGVGEQVGLKGEGLAVGLRT